MPEGDTIFRSARTLHLALAGRAVTVFDTVFPALARVHEDHPIVGRQVLAVRSLGKHLLIELSGGLVLRTHMRMNGSWHVYRPAERWRRPRSSMRIVIGNDEYLAVGFDIPVAEFLASRDIGRHPLLRALGPDLLGEPFDAAEAVRRLRAKGEAPLADALLDQRAVAGVGNVFKSEILFVAGLDPFRTVASLDDDQLAAVVAVARKLLHENVIDPSRPPGATWSGQRRTTRSANPAARLWVYGRGGRRCRRCGTAIAFAKRGPDVRGTYWCPACQR